MPQPVLAAAPTKAKLTANVAQTNRQLKLQSRPKGLLAPGDLQLAEAPLPSLTDGQALARVKYLSIDPTMRVWMATDSYVPAVAIGEVMRGFGFAEVGGITPQRIQEGRQSCWAHRPAGLLHHRGGR